VTKLFQAILFSGSVLLIGSTATALAQLMRKGLGRRDVRLFLTVLFLSGFSSLLRAQTAPSTYSAYTGTDTKTIPPAPALGSANSVITDPTFGSRILRVTDPNTNGGESFISTDAGFHRTWNANSTAIKLTGPHGDGYWLEFSPSTFSVGTGSSDPVIHPVSFGATWEWSTVDPDRIYFLNGNQIGEYNTSTRVTTNIGGPSNGDPVAYMAVVLGQDDWVCAAAGSGGQDTYTEIFCVNPASPSIYKLIDVYKKTINGVPQTDPNWPTSAPGQTIGIHDISGGTGASWLEVTFHQQSWGANGGAVFDLATNTWSLVTAADIYWSGHVSMGNGKYANSAGSINGSDSRGLVVRNPDNLMNSADYLFVDQPPNTLNQWCDDDHNSWLNSLTNPNAPILSSRYTIVGSCQFAWAGEIDAVAVDGSNTVWRFAHNHTGVNCYYGEGFAQISNDGNWALFSSPWDGTLGPDTSFGCTTRIDTFIVQLANGPPPPPPAPALNAATAVSSTEIDLAWTNPAGSSTTANSVLRCTGSACTPSTVVASLAATAAGYHDISAAASTTYTYLIRASNARGSSNSNVRGATTPAPSSSAPPAPALNSATAVSPTEIDLAWTNPAGSSATGDSVLRCTGSACTPSTVVASLAATAAGYHDTSAEASTTYTYLIRASNPSASSNSNVRGATTPAPSSSKVVRYEWNNSAVQYTGTWYPKSYSWASGGSIVMAMDAGGQAKFTFTGTGVKWIGYRDQWSGIAQVYLDGVLKATIDTYAASAQTQATVYAASGLSNAPHSLTIEVTGQHDSNSGGDWVWVNAFDVTTVSSTAGSSTPAAPAPSAKPTRIEQNSTAVVYTGTWFPKTYAWASGGSIIMSMDTNARATLTFTGTAVSWIGYRDQWSGIAQVYVDGVLKGTIDTYAASAQTQASIYTASGLTDRSHTLAIEITGTHNAVSGGSWVWVDAFVVTP